MDLPRENTISNLFSTYKRTAGIAFAAILIIAIPVTLALLSQQQDVRQRASTAAYINGAYKWDGTCVAGCEGTVSHVMQVTTTNPSNGEFSGKGYYTSDPKIKWNITGKENPDRSFTYRLVYTTSSPGYSATGSGRIESDGNLTASLRSSQNETGTIIASRTVCQNLPPRCTIVSATGTPSCESGLAFPSKPDNVFWCPVQTNPRQVASCSTNADCTSDKECKVVRIAESYPPVETKECVPKSCENNTNCPAGFSCENVPAGPDTPSFTKQCMRDQGNSDSSIFDLNDDGRHSLVDLNILYSNFRTRQGD